MGVTTRLGMLTPSSNTALEPETYRMLARFPDVSAHFTRIPVTRIDLDAGAAAQFSAGPMLAAATLLADARVDVLAWNGTSGSWLGADGDRELAAALSQVSGVPATTSTLALLAAFRAYSVRRLGLVTPYREEVATAIAGQYAREGVTVASERHLGISDNEAFARVGSGKLGDLIAGVAASNVDAVGVVCTNLHGAQLAERLEEQLKVPVFDSITATLWHSLLLGGGDQPVTGYGSLLLSGGTRVRLVDACERLLTSTGADRITVRLDLPGLGLGVNRPCAEASRDGISPLGAAIAGEHRRLDTVAWLDQHRRALVQPDFSGPPWPPAALRDTYGVQAQMLGPVIRASVLAGWLSVHSRRERDWCPDDLHALADATAAVHAVLDRLEQQPDPDTRRARSEPAIPEQEMTS